jgi:hypothetical protein
MVVERIFLKAHFKVFQLPYLLLNLPLVLSDVLRQSPRAQGLNIRINFRFYL